MISANKDWSKPASRDPPGWLWKHPGELRRWKNPPTLTPGSHRAAPEPLLIHNNNTRCRREQVFVLLWWCFKACLSYGHDVQHRPVCFTRGKHGIFCGLFHTQGEGSKAVRRYMPPGIVVMAPSRFSRYVPRFFFTLLVFLFPRHVFLAISVNKPSVLKLNFWKWEKYSRVGDLYHIPVNLEFFISTSKMDSVDVPELWRRLVWKL